MSERTAAAKKASRPIPVSQVTHRDHRQCPNEGPPAVRLSSAERAGMLLRWEAPLETLW